MVAAAEAACFRVQRRRPASTSAVVDAARGLEIPLGSRRSVAGERWDITSAVRCAMLLLTGITSGDGLLLGWRCRERERLPLCTTLYRLAPRRLSCIAGAAAALPPTLLILLAFGTFDTRLCRSMAFSMRCGCCSCCCIPDAATGILLVTRERRMYVFHLLLPLLVAIPCLAAAVAATVDGVAKERLAVARSAPPPAVAPAATPIPACLRQLRPPG